MKDEKFKKWYMNTEVFTYHNENPEPKKRGYVWDRADCVIRALAKAGNISWLEAFDFLTEKARRDFNVVNDGVASRKWMEEAGAVWTPCKAEKGKARMKVGEFAKAHPKGRFVIHMANHQAACVDGKVYDVWNCTDKAVVGYLDMTNFTI